MQEKLVILLKKAIDSLKVYAMLKIKQAIPMLEELVIAKIKELLSKAQGFIKEEKYEIVKMELIERALKNIQLPLIARPFKGLIKKELSKTLDKNIEKLLEEAGKRLDK